MCLLVGLALWPLACRQSESRVPLCEESKPNLIVIVADDLGYGDLSSYGNTAYTTPNIDRLAAEGMRFTDFHSASPVCRAARIALLTGRYPHRSGIEGNEAMARGALDASLVGNLRDAGYTTGLVGKWHLGNREPFYPTRHGFDYFRGFLGGSIDYISHVSQRGEHDWWDGDQPVEETGYVTRLISDHTVGFIERNRHRPFFLYVAHAAPHFPYQAPGDEAVRVLGEPSDAEERSSNLAAYGAMVKEVDASVGRAIETIRRLGLEKRTFVFFYSDNGAAPQNGSNGPLAGRKGTTWEGGHRVPAIAWWPERIEPLSVTDATTISLDLMPTFLEISGFLPSPEYAIDGVSLLPLLLGHGAPGERYLFWEYYDGKRDIVYRSVRHGSWKLVTNNQHVSLFNLAHDLGEKQNRASDHPERVADFLAAFDAWKAQVSSGAELSGGSEREEQSR